MGLINKGCYGMFLACGIWCLADVSSVCPSSEQTVVDLERLGTKFEFPAAILNIYSSGELRVFDLVNRLESRI